MFLINISGSHKLPIKKRFVRNPEKKDSDDKMLIFQGTEDDHKPSNKDWIPAPVKKGKVKDTKYYQQLVKFFMILLDFLGVILRTCIGCFSNIIL